MESHPLTTRTYTAPTCELTIVPRTKQLSRLDAPGDRFRSPQSQPKFDFTLHLDHPDRGEQERITVQGEPQQLDRLQRIVSQYIAELVAKFPLPTANQSAQPAAPEAPVAIDLPDEPSISNQLYPDREERNLKSGLMKNLPGLRDRSAQSSPVSNPSDRPPAAKSGISKLLGFWHKPDERPQSRPEPLGANAAVEPAATSGQAASANVPTAPYITGGDRSLDHQLHLGDLATPTSGAAVNLSAIQLFDLAIVLDEYALEHASTQDRGRSAPPNRSTHAVADVMRANADTTATPLSRLPNLPKIPAVPATTEVYHKQRRSHSSFMSAIPWAAAAAVAVSAPLLLLDPNSNPLKDAASKVKMPNLKSPNLAGGQKSPTSPMDGTPATQTAPGNIASAPDPSKLPKPWQEQPVTPPPTATKPLDPSLQTPQITNKIGIAPLPEAIVGKPGQPGNPGNLATNSKPGVATSTLPSPGLPSGIAPNPLNNNQLPDLNSNSIGDPTTGLPTTGTLPTAKSTPVAAAQPRPIAAASKAKPKTGGRGATPVDALDPGNVSVSRQPMSIPSANLPPIDNKLPSPIPFNPPNIDPPAQSEPIAKPQNPKKVGNTNKSKPKAVPTGLAVTPQSSFEPFTPVPKNPNLINPEDIPNNTGNPEPQNPPVVPDKPLQSNNPGVAGPEAVEPPALQEAKRYFQGKWKPDTAQTNALQYVIQVNGKGIVRSVAPQGEAATTYLQQNKLIEPGQKLISPAAGGSNQKIRVLLEPDGNVDTFIEP